MIIIATLATHGFHAVGDVCCSYLCIHLLLPFALVAGAQQEVCAFLVGHLRQYTRFNPHQSNTSSSRVLIDPSSHACSLERLCQGAYITVKGPAKHSYKCTYMISMHAISLQVGPLHRSSSVHSFTLHSQRQLLWPPAPPASAPCRGPPG